MNGWTEWTPELVIDALQRWHREHGTAPSTEDWMAAGRLHPCSQTVRQVFGSMHDAREAAGTPFVRRNSAGDWTQESVKEAVYRWVFEHGRLPRYCDWVSPSPDRPSSHVVRSLFGYWSAALVAAGYTPPRGRSAKGYAALRKTRVAGQFVKAQA